MSPKKAAHPIWRMTKIVAGVSLLVLGVVGLFLPILQGVLFLFLGLAVLATENRHAREVVETLKRRHPGPWKRVEKLKERITKLLNLRSGGESEEEASGDEGSSRKTT